MGGAQEMTSPRTPILIGRGGEIGDLPRTEWEASLARVPGRFRTRLAFMSDEHHAVRYFVVREMARRGAPITPEHISEQLNLPSGRTTKILTDLERHLLFLVRNDRGAVSWAFPVTTERTDHHLTFSTGERLDAA